MTLRLRLVLALVALVTVGLFVFGVVTYGFYARSQYQRLDDQLRSSADFVTVRLIQEAGLGGDFPPTNPNNPNYPNGGGNPNNPIGGGNPNNPNGGGIGGPRGGFGGPSVGFLTYGELRDASGQVVGTPIKPGGTSAPVLPSTLPSSSPFDDESGQWRVYAAPAKGAPGYTVVVAQPVTEVHDQLEQLILIEAAAAGVLLASLAVGSWFILRHGLRPLEHMATSARTITAGDLSERVSPSDAKSEVGQLGLALNTMLARIEVAFQERDATERRLRQFLADASHELRTPLTSIQGFAELFRLGAEHDHVNLEVILRRIEEESARMKILVEDLLLLAHLDETRPTERSPVNLTVLAADACSDAVALDPDRAVTLDAPEPVIVLGDQDHLRQAIANLVTNAVKHTPDGSAIEVSTRIDDGAAIVMVRDHGSGLSDDSLAHVFDRFWQADGARVGSGVGLGLAIVEGIASEHGGVASVHNAPDGGAVFRISLPLNAPTPAPAPNPTSRV